MSQVHHTTRREDLDVVSTELGAEPAGVRGSFHAGVPRVSGSRGFHAVKTDRMDRLEFGDWEEDIDSIRSMHM